ncbi:hypothetical protein OS493_020791 [Desmophyllum pertusum]|uniref:Uncharacterized protein n=1 Tax=Desmophyllum pertusum TaxID=174260 RepID=A0A9X0CJM0_9CNID|nr:hypothetical protein OS493_020791 [Desmophyllum pertusum]
MARSIRWAWSQSTPEMQAELSSIAGLRGFSRETVIEITTNIESQEFRRRQNVEIGYVENPRAAETDDLECLYGFQLKWRKIVREFTKRMDPDLPFFYHTVNERYSSDLLPSFDEPPAGCESDDEGDDQRNPYRLHRLVRNTREDGSIFAAGRSFLPARNRTSTRQRFHRYDVGLRPVPQGYQSINNRDLQIEVRVRERI